MYTDYFGLRERPFSITPDARYLYLSPHHREALAHLHFGIGEGGGFVQLTGDVGTGKTTVCRALLEQLPPHVDTALVLNPAVTVQELLQTVCEELLIDVPPGCQSTKTFVERLNGYLLDANARGRRSILIIDEAQNLSKDVLEQVRLLTNLETNESKLLQIFLIGQPELRDLLSDKGMRQVAQRVTARFHLPGLDASESREYIQHRLAVAGCARMLFSTRAVRRIYRLTKGVPRLINILCDRSLLGAYVTGRQRVSARIVGRAYRELAGRTTARRWTWAHAAIAASGTAVAGLVIAWGLATPWYSLVSSGSSGSLATQTASGTILGPPPQKIQNSENGPDTLSSLPATEGPSLAGSLPGADSPPVAESLSVAEDASAGEILPATGSPPVAGNAATAQNAPLAENIPASESIAMAESTPATENTPVVADAPVAESASVLQNPQEASAPAVAPDAPQMPEAPADRLLAEWGVPPRSSVDVPLCEWAQLQGLRCLVGHGDWSDLRRLNRPAIISLLSARGDAVPAVVTAMTKDSVTLGLRGGSIAFPLKESAQTWRGEYLLLWRPPLPSAGLVSTGSSGALVLWLRKALKMIDGSNDPETHGLAFDGALEQRIKAFQRSRNILVDGVVGQETLIHLNTALGNPATPLLGQSPAS